MLVVEKAGFQITRERAGVWNDVFREWPTLGLTFANLKRPNETPHIFQSAKLSPDSSAPCGEGISEQARSIKKSQIKCPLVLLSELAQCCFQFRHRRKQICHQAIIRHLKNRCFFVLVDGNDDFGILHARQMLDGS